MAWQKGPLPPGTYNWGGVVPHGENMGMGFWFADFCGDHVKIIDGSNPPRELKAWEVAWWNNSLDLPPSGKGRVGSTNDEEKK